MESAHPGPGKMDIQSNIALIETMHASSTGEVALLELHLDRLLRSAQTLGYETTGREAIRSRVIGHLFSHPMPGRQQRVRLLMDHVGQIQIESYALTALSDLPLVAISPLRLDSRAFFLQHKTTYRPWYADATSWLGSHPNFFDLIFLNEKNEVCEGSRSNIYLLQDGVWVTPPLSCGLLAGVLRRQLLASGKVVERTIPASALEATHAQLRLSNALRGWFDVQLTRLPVVPD